MSEWVVRVLSALTLGEKIRLLAGENRWETVPIDRVGIPALKVTDGPNGARGADPNHGPTSTSFPVGAAMGATFDPDLIEQVGRALADETRAKGAHVLLAPTVNIPRVPVAGRNFECLSEDPMLSGTLAAAYVNGVQAEGVGACIKHFVCNDQEHERTTISADVDERTLREVYLEPFRIAVERSGPWAAMSGYNAINGVTASEHPMLDEILRDEFGFDGVVISDWDGTYSPAIVASGLDLEMPGPARWMSAEHVHDALHAGSIEEELINVKVARLLTLLERTGASDRGGPQAETTEEAPAHRDLARRVARESIVLLENNTILPLADLSRIAVIGELAARTPHQGGGSSRVNPHRVISIAEGIEAAAPDGTEVVWFAGPDPHRLAPPLDAVQVSHGEGTPGLLVEYYTGSDLGGSLLRAVPTSNSFLGFFGEDDPLIGSDAFSVRLSGSFRAAVAGRHVFSVTARGRVRIMAGGEVGIDAWKDDSPELHQWEADLAAGQELELVVEYAPRPDEHMRWVGIGCAPPAPDDPIREACREAAESDVAIVVVGLTPEWESEGFDRADLNLPGEQARLVEEVAAIQPNTVVVVTAGSAVEMPWRDDVAAVLYAWYGGQEVGHAVADVLFGHDDPGGRLPVTFPLSLEQHPGMLNYPGEAGAVSYGEGVYVGYRGFDRMGLQPMYPFGYGLSYTTFELDDVTVDVRDEGLVISATLSNVGDRAGTEVVQVFAKDLGDVPRRLVGFQKYQVDAGASVGIEIPILSEHLRWWDPEDGDWAPPNLTTGLEVRGTFGAVTAAAQLPATK